jgi:hypothetical protein
MATFGKLYTVGYAALEEIESLQSFIPASVYGKDLLQIISIYVN